MHDVKFSFSLLALENCGNILQKTFLGNSYLLDYSIMSSLDNDKDVAALLVNVNSCICFLEIMGEYLLGI